jgi:hypothetical protein
MQTQGDGGDISYTEIFWENSRVIRGKDTASESHVGEHFDPETQTEHNDRILLLLHRGGVYIPKDTHPKDTHPKQS